MGNETKLRIRVGLGLLSLLLGVLLWQTPQPLSVFRLAVQEEGIIHANLYSEWEREVYIRVQSGSQLLFPQQVLVPGAIAPFSLPRSYCRRAVQVWIDDLPPREVSGNLCPENFPDETKTIVISRGNPLLAVGEDRE